MKIFEGLAIANSKIFECKDEANSFHPTGDKKKAHLQRYIFLN